MEHTKFTQVEQRFRAFISSLDDLDVELDQVHIERYDRHVPGVIDLHLSVDVTSKIEAEDLRPT